MAESILYEPCPLTPYWCFRVPPEEFAEILPLDLPPDWCVVFEHKKKRCGCDDFDHFPVLCPDGSRAAAAVNDPVFLKPGNYQATLLDENGEPVTPLPGDTMICNNTQCGTAPDVKRAA